MDPVALISVLTGLLSRAAEIGQLIETARSEGRDITPDELDRLRAADDSARGDLVLAIDKARSEGR
jgi:hypothetical protein